MNEWSLKFFVKADFDATSGRACLARRLVACLCIHCGLGTKHPTIRYTRGNDRGFAAGS